MTREVERLFGRLAFRAGAAPVRLSESHSTTHTRWPSLPQPSGLLFRDSATNLISSDPVFPALRRHGGGLVKSSSEHTAIKVIQRFETDSSQSDSLSGKLNMHYYAARTATLIWAAWINCLVSLEREAWRNELFTVFYHSAICADSRVVQLEDIVFMSSKL